MQGTVNGIEYALDMGSNSYRHAIRTIGLGMKAVNIGLIAAALFAGCATTGDSEVQRIRGEHQETSQTTPLPSGSKHYNQVNREVYEPIRRRRARLDQEKREHDAIYSKQCRPGRPNSDSLEESCKKWRENH